MSDLMMNAPTCLTQNITCTMLYVRTIFLT